jgi:hypothetical protein
MATAEGLMGLGQPAELALRTGISTVAVTTTAATQNSAGGLLKGAGNKLVLVNAAGANGAVTLPAEAGVGDVVELFNVSGNTALVFPPTGGTINQGTANQFVSVLTNASLYAVKAGVIGGLGVAHNWRVMPSAAVTPA